MTDMPPTPHGLGKRVRDVFDCGREGVVIESNPAATLIEFEEEGAGGRFTHRKWLPTRHWAPVS